MRLFKRSQSYPYFRGMRTFIYLFIILLLSSCKGLEGDFTRQNISLDLTDKENLPLTLTTQHLSYLMIEGMVDDQLTPYLITYTPEYKVEKVLMDSVINRLTFDYDDYYVETMHDYASLGLDATLVKIDEWVRYDESVITSRKGNYIHLYYPSDLTSNGLEYYITSFEYDEVMEFLGKKGPLWFEYYIEKWGWLTPEIRMQDYTNAQNEAIDIIDILLSDTTQEINENLMKIRENRPERLITGPVYESSDNASKMTLYVTSEFGDQRTGLLSYSKAEPVASKLSLINPKPEIHTYNYVINFRKFSTKGDPETISKNENFIDTEAVDPTFKKLKDKDFGSLDTLKGTELFEFVVVENMNFEATSLVNDIFNGIRDGKINAYDDDLFTKQIQDSTFFNRWIIPAVFEGDEVVMYKSDQVKRFQLVRKVNLNSDLSFNSQEVIGIGLFIPALYTEIGLNHLLGYISIDDINKVYKGETVDFNMMSGIPFKKYPLKQVKEGASM